MTVIGLFASFSGFHVHYKNSHAAFLCCECINSIIFISLDNVFFIFITSLSFFTKLRKNELTPRYFVNLSYFLFPESRMHALNCIPLLLTR